MNYPLSLSFKIIALAPQVRVTDAGGQLLMYVRQKLLALKENVKIFADEGQTQLLFEIQADRIIDFSARYTIRTAAGQVIGSVKRKGLRSLWSATYEIQDAGGQDVGLIKEENPWLKVLDSILSEIPFLGMLVNPAYLISLRGQQTLYLKKQPAVFEGKFTLDRQAQASATDEQLLIASTIMAMMLERSRG
jgi:uncharacterized protein YxjI